MEPNHYPAMQVPTWYGPCLFIIPPSFLLPLPFPLPLSILLPLLFPLPLHFLNMNSALVDFRTLDNNNQCWT